jgi:hypothetical protein
MFGENRSPPRIVWNKPRHARRLRLLPFTVISLGLLDAVDFHFRRLPPSFNAPELVAAPWRFHLAERSELQREGMTVIELALYSDTRWRQVSVYEPAIGRETPLVIPATRT